MKNNCIICENQAEYFIKDTDNGYCKDCALDYFSDLSYLEKAEKQAQNLKSHLR